MPIKQIVLKAEELSALAKDPLAICLPAEVDTNESYKLVGKDGTAIASLVYDTIIDEWLFLPF